MSNEVMDYLKSNSSGNSYPSFKFDHVGATAKGTIIDTPRVVNTTDLNTGEPSKTLVVEIETDDGDKFSVWIQKGNIVSAVKAAITASGADGLHEGGTLAIKYTGDGEQTKRGFNPPKLYSAAYKPPVASGVNVDDLLAG